MRTAVALALGLLLLCGCSSSPTTRPTTAGLPQVSLAAFGGGRPLDLRTFKGPAVLNVWASWCGPCRRELPHYQSFSEKYAGKVRVVGIDFEDPSTTRARALVRSTGVGYPLYADPDGRVGARVLPELILVDAHGRVAFRKYVQISSVAQLARLVEDHLGVRL
jgi:thiol-disulfide isomerase/thioredoxin